MDAKYLEEIKAREQEAKAEKQKGNDLDCACLSWAIVLNDLPTLLAEVEQDERDKAAQYMEIVRLREQITTLKSDKKRAEKALELACRYHRFDDFKTVRSEIEFFAQQAQEQEGHDGRH